MRSGRHRTIPLLNNHCDQRILHRMVRAGILLLLVAALIAQAGAARDVKVALTELKPSLYTNEQGEPAGFFVDIVEDI